MHILCLWALNAHRDSIQSLFHVRTSLNQHSDATDTPFPELKMSYVQIPYIVVVVQRSYLIELDFYHNNMNCGVRFMEHSLQFHTLQLSYILLKSEMWIRLIEIHQFFFKARWSNLCMHTLILIIIPRVCLYLMSHLFNWNYYICDFMAWCWLISLFRQYGRIAPHLRRD
jgi:hypothetical protein